MSQAPGGAYGTSEQSASNPSTIEQLGTPGPASEPSQARRPKGRARDERDFGDSDTVRGVV